MTVPARWSHGIYQSICQLGVNMRVAQAFKAPSPAQRLVFRLTRTLHSQTQFPTTEERNHQAHLTSPKQI